MNKTILLFVGLIALNTALFAQTSLEKNGLKLIPVNDSPAFPEATLSLTTPDLSKELPIGKDTFNFKIENYSLGVQTPDADQKMCANSAKGQHIHFMIDNAPYTSTYNTSLVGDVKEGHHVILAFLSRSYHESLKTKKAYILKEFNAGKVGLDNFDERAPHIFFSRPKGEYTGNKEITRLLLDFFLVNCTLSEKGYKVRATINGNEFMLTKWIPYFIEGLQKGEVKVKLELLDKNNQLVKSPFNGTERTVKLLGEEPLK